ncbi:MAG: NYN domain-containing protein, partial [Chloroflexota bacterium]|nr:NYN domain-containing protein [Chloroflexota bacterium]
MSKNVAVFVDVANIFYAAKAAGVDIDYVTLLKSASAGRDLVRAYAYTGLDPENENQRQFHSFLSRSGYKVISKDIRKYGDGRIKANLDIELVVDMMRMATHLDIAVVISGDGDFAPAIRAVQQMGVRVEVISFRGNTSSDLIEVADVFIDITQVARVEKGARSGRRVAAEGDLSMTEVPDKETEGAARRRRTPRRTPERVAAIAPVADAPDISEAEELPGNIIVLPGERLSRVGPEEDERDEGLMEEPDVASAEAAGSAAEGSEMETDADGRRRRRRRGGRGRGRGRREDGQPETAGPVMIEPAVVADITETAAVSDSSEAPEDDEEFLDESPVAIPQHSTFGSVWDSQMGVPAAPLTATPLTEDEEDFDEPEIPEYLLAERRQQQQRNRGGRSGGGCQGNRGGRGGGSYRTALDRERFGRSGVSSFGGAGAAAGNMSRPPDRQRGRDQRPQAPNRQNRPFMREAAAPQQQSRPPQQPRPPQQATRPGQEAEPWSEVPAEVQALLRAELARRSGRPDAPSDRPAEEAQAPTPVEAPALVEAPASGEDREPLPTEAQDAPASPARKRAPRTTARAKAASASAVTGSPEAEEAVPEKVPARRRAARTRVA